MGTVVEMVRSEAHRGWLGWQVDDLVGARVGTVQEVLRDPETDLTWLVVAMGRITRQVTLVPATDAMAGGEHVWVPIERDRVRAAPRAIADGAWHTGSYRSLIYRHYGLVGLPRRRGAGATTAAEAS
jgi:hypothetical protein